MIDREDIETLVREMSEKPPSDPALEAQMRTLALLGTTTLKLEEAFSAINILVTASNSLIELTNVLSREVIELKARLNTVESKLTDITIPYAPNFINSDGH